ncbi:MULTISPECIES: flagellar motor protein MotB [unclassified Haematospirillum]|uniref:OmpA/MotB family protein n=1 Tax=unclassified Haematospirillum TaxID=2622088 RepID=UPI001438F476|nr:MULTISPECIES: flagellar motor protein MotB [unclassified Haematospirillum]NKD55831.1 hypothetical protein [Haematospirillum sp. H4890]NKD75858.1 hypothetical protein [Haematospirillum sp. H4485]NKD87964.1 hypothetical protein [Haematospirillum sp. 15-248]
MAGYKDGEPYSTDSALSKDIGTSSGVWIYTFTDLILLLLSFFVMLYAMGNPDLRYLRSLVDGISTRPAPLVIREVSETSPDLSMVQVAVSPGQNISYLRALIGQTLQNEPRLNGMVMTMSDDQLVLSLPGKVLFLAGEAVPAPGGSDILAEVANLVSRLDNRLVIAGRADGGQTGSAVAWTLSLARARVVAQAMRSAGYPGDLGLVGYGGARPVAVVPADAVQPVDILILPERNRR